MGPANLRPRSGSGQAGRLSLRAALSSAWERRAEYKKPSVNNNQITQNVKDLLSSREVENIFENSDYIYMLNQASGDRQILAKHLNISPHQLSYVTHSGEGEG